MTKVLEANSVECPPKGEHGEECMFFRVGAETTVGNPIDDMITRRKVTRITVSDDLPGPNCMLWQVKVYSGDSIICWHPLHAVEYVGFEHGKVKEGDM